MGNNTYNPIALKTLELDLQGYNLENVLLALSNGYNIVLGMLNHYISSNELVAIVLRHTYFS